MQAIGVLAYSESVLGDVTELRSSLERLGYAVHLQQLGYDLSSMENGYFEEGSLLLLLGRCYADPARCGEIAAKYVETGVDLIVAMEVQAVRIAIEASAHAGIPVVFTHVTDLILEGLAKRSDRQPELLTGVRDPWLESSAQRLAMLTQVVPAPSAVHIFTDLAVPILTAEAKVLSGEAEKLGLELIVHHVSGSDQARQELISLQARPDQALFRTSDPSLASLANLMGAIARERYIPYIGINVDEMERCSALFVLETRGIGTRVAVLVDRILKGEPPASIPFTTPERQLLGINLQAALDLGLVVSPGVVEKAQVIVPQLERTSLGGRMVLVLFMSSLLLGLIGAVAALNPTLPRLGVAIGAAAIVALLLWVYLQWRIIRPIQHLTRIAEEIGAGNLDVEIGESHVQDEIGVLGRTFRRMRSNLMYSQAELQKLTASLRQQIRERAQAYQALQRAQQDLEIASRRIIEADDSSRFALTTYIHDEVLVLLDELAEEARQSGVRTLEEITLAIDQHIRRVRFGLSVPVIQDMDVELRRLVQEILPQYYSASRSIKLSLDISDLKSVPDLEPAYSVLLYRFVSGTMSNVFRHAQASQVSLRITRTDEQLVVRVEDDGIGFDPAQIEGYIRAGHYFFHDISVRAWQLGGSLHVDSIPGGGTRMEVVVPIIPGSTKMKYPGSRGSKRGRK